MEKINHLFRRVDQVRHERVEQEKRKAEGQRLKSVTSSASWATRL